MQFHFTGRQTVSSNKVCTLINPIIEYRIFLKHFYTSINYLLHNCFGLFRSINDKILQVFIADCLIQMLVMYLRCESFSVSKDGL